MNSLNNSFTHPSLHLLLIQTVVRHWVEKGKQLVMLLREEQNIMVGGWGEDGREVGNRFVNCLFLSFILHLCMNIFHTCSLSLNTS